MRRSRTHASNTGTPTKITRITDYFGQPQITPKKKKPEGNHITNYFKRANSEDKDETSNEKRPRISLGVIDDDTDHIEHIHVDNHDIVLDTERSVPSTPSSRNNVVLIDLDEDDRELSSSMPLELSSDDDEPEDGLTLLDITPSKSAVRLSTRARSPPTSPTIASRLRRQPAVSYKIDMSLIDSDDVKENKQTRAKLRKEESNTQILALQSDSTSIINELDTMFYREIPYSTDNDAIKDWVFTFFTNTVDMNSEQYQRETRQAMKVLASESPLSIDSQEQLETMLLDGVLAQLEGVGFVYRRRYFPGFSTPAWQLFELLAPQYNFRSWLSEGIIENILTINGASKSYLHKELMLSMVDLIRAPSTETLPQGIGYLLRAYPMIISRQEPPVIYHHFSLLLRIALDKRTIQWQPHIHQCIIATKRILNDCAIGDWKQSLLNYLWKHHDFTPVIIKLLNSLPALCLDLIQFRRELAEYYLVRMMTYLNLRLI
ncbi:hypothetical protein BDF22DRAFT_744526 [Syncephalis plumigaleata]|nr:hypothetical protein BDF22DRAFT_744526 [Syncephalis plumigaleata]